MKNIKIEQVIIFFMILCGLSSCSEFLDVKPDGKMVVPTTLADCEMLLNDYSTMNCSYPNGAEVSSDDYYLPLENWQAISNVDEKNLYIWADHEPRITFQWMNAYKIVFTANQVLKVLLEHNTSLSETAQYRNLEGAAYFYRAFTFQQLMINYALPYKQATAGQELGIPLKLSPDLDETTSRPSISACYDQIIVDYRKAVSLLGSTPVGKGLPGKAAAYAGLARLYLDMQDYQKAYHYADSSLQLSGALLDYNGLNANSFAPIPIFNIEVLFPATTGFSYALMQGNARIDDDLYNSYSSSDLRKKIYFMKNYDLEEISYDFKGTYDNTQMGNFVGLTSSEMYVVKAEAAVRLSKVDVALAAINNLLKYRYPAADFQPITVTDEADLLQLILEERRKELVFRGLRWADLKRLNQDPATQKNLVRQLGTETYSLAPNSLSYALLIPMEIINTAKIEQNKR